MARFLVVPQWQGSPSARAMQLRDGAAAIAGDLPRAATTTLDVPLEAGESLGTGVNRLSTLVRTQEMIREAFSEGTILVGGDCSITVPALGALPGGTDDVAVVWCDAHPDLHTPASSSSGAFSGMALRAILGEGEERLSLSPGVVPEHIVVVGARVVDEEETEPLSTLTRVSASELAREESLADAIAATGARRVWVHIDVDVFDPSAVSGVSTAAPFGVDPALLAASIRALRTRFPLAGATVAGFAPRSPADAVDDLGALLRIVGALV